MNNTEIAQQIRALVKGIDGTETGTRLLKLAAEIDPKPMHSPGPYRSKVGLIYANDILIAQTTHIVGGGSFVPVANAKRIAYCLDAVEKQENATFEIEENPTFTPGAGGKNCALCGKPPNQHAATGQCPPPSPSVIVQRPV